MANKGQFNGTPGPGKPKGTTFKKLTTSEKAEAIALWEAGEVTLKDLSERFGRAEETFSRLFKRSGVTKGSKRAEHEAKVRAEVERQAKEDAAVLAKRIKDTKEEHYSMATALGKLTWNEIIECKRRGDNFSVIQSNLKSLHIAIDALKKVREERYAVLGLNIDGDDEDDSLPELVIAELTADQIEELRNREFNNAKTPIQEVDELTNRSEEADHGDGGA